ncbi:tubulin polyglutamylase complex subunit 2-like isoform X1 [Patiria miniata]|uniref:Tubulin polyglutamylase complex subunit 2 n=1 Tax=Patiria miniata TaxID=46514 RepID=A0A914B8K2_PATMI|nr:tubulin polyglutamylase complex subunit 2-like isoform X1 [Patiria miniata]
MANFDLTTLTSMEEIPHTKDLFNQLTLGVVKSLEKRAGICDITLADLQPAERHQVVSWEQRSSCMLPDDLKRFYLTSDGLLLTWSVRFDDQMQQVGRMEINKISNVTKLAGNKAPSNANTPSLADVDYASDDEDTDVPAKPHFDTRSRIFELDPCRGIAKVCLVYRNTKPGSPAQHPEVWLLDRALRWHFLAHTFSQYFRMMLMHLGLPQWQLAYTDVGLSPQAKQWFNLYSPLRIRLDSETSLAEEEPEKDDSWQAAKGAPKMDSTEVNKLDFGRVFKGKSDKKSKSSQNRKKHGPVGKPLSGGTNNRSGSQLGGGRLR